MVLFFPVRAMRGTIQSYTEITERKLNAFKKHCWAQSNR